MGPLTEISKRKRKEKRGIEINSGPQQQHSPQVPWPPRSGVPRLLCPQ